MSEVESQDETPVTEPDESAAPADEPDAESLDEDETQTATPDETEGDAAAEETPPSVEGLSERDIEAKFRRIGRAYNSFTKKVDETMGADVSLLTPCPLCTGGIPSFLFPDAGSRIDHDTRNAVLVAIGEPPREVTEQDPFSRICETCNGQGRVLSGSHVNAWVTLACIPCNGTGWVAVGDERRSVTTPAQPVAVTPNGATETAEPAPDLDPWGRPATDPDYGRMPIYANRLHGVTA